MLSRTNFRIKVLQSLYANEVNPTDGRKLETFLMKSINDSYRLYLLTMLYLQKVASYSQKDLEIKQKKYVPSEEDKKASSRLFENPVITSLRDNDVFQKTLKKEGIFQLVDEDLTRRLFKNYTENEYYETYRTLAEPPVREHQYAIVKLYMTMKDDEVFSESLSDLFPNWDDDESLVYGAVKRSIRSLPENPQFFIEQLPSDEFVEELGKDLLHAALKNNEEIQQLIAAKLKNWQEDRVAMLDMIMMKMAVCEFLFFETIPVKVTINEYINIAKFYSTDKSKRFVNGILDKILQELNLEGKIIKTGRGLIDE
jgi:N utilization substance protein B